MIGEQDNVTAGWAFSEQTVNPPVDLIVKLGNLGISNRRCKQIEQFGSRNLG
jgi:hypothetical protein